MTQGDDSDNEWIREGVGAQAMTLMDVLDDETAELMMEGFRGLVPVIDRLKDAGLTAKQVLSLLIGLLVETVMPE